MARSTSRYEEMRDFTRTPEPPPARVSRTGPLTFTIQKHAARRLHYDLRLEIDGVLVSWPIPKGPSYDPTVRRLAIQTEDHPYDYGTFEGIIPRGEYGGGEVIVWDAGTYTVLLEDAELPNFRNRELAERRAREGLQRGRLRVFLNGRKLKGGWTLTRTRGEGTGSQWLFIKRRDGLEDPNRDVTLEDRSVLSGLRIEDLKAGSLPRQDAHASLRPTAEGLAGARRAPFPSPFDPMLPTLTSSIFQDSDWLYEPKLGGYRILAFVDNGQVQLRSDGGQSYEEQFPGIVRALAGQPIDTAVFDGELVARAVNYYVFDLLYLDRFDLLNVPLRDRKPLLHAVLAPIGGLHEVASFDDGLSLLQAAQVNGLEGIVAKKRDSVYKPGRRVRTWLEIKTSRDAQPRAVVQALARDSTPLKPEQSDQVAVALQALDSQAETARLQLDGYELRLTSLNKVFWPAYGERRPLTKRDLVRYYLQIARYVLPHLRDRPVTMTRYPDGIHSSRFYQRSPRDSAPAFVKRFLAFSERNNTDDEYFVCNNLPTLIWLAQLADLELHVSHTRIVAEPDAPHLATTFTGSLEQILRSTLNYPDFLVVDLDPYLYSGKEAPGAEPELHPAGFARARDVAHWFRELLQQVGMHPFVKTTGRTGLHLYVPIARTLDYDSVRAVAETLARQVERAHPEVVTTEWAVSARRGKVFLDFNMNRRWASLAAVYSPRAVEWAGVSMPFDWDELDSIYPTQFDILNVPERLAQRGDVWEHILDARVDLRQLLGS